jgi:hypothetical protein
VRLDLDVQTEFRKHANPFFTETDARQAATREPADRGRPWTATGLPASRISAAGQHEAHPDTDLVEAALERAATGPPEDTA